MYQKSTREQNQGDVERHQANERLEDMYRRLKRAEREIEDSKNDGIQFQQTITSLEHDKKTSIDQIRTLNSTQETQLRMTINKYESQVNGITVKLENVSESHASTSRDMQKLLGSQRLIGEKWRDESEQIKSHYEQMVNKLKVNLGQFQERINELETIIMKNTAQRRDLIDQVTIEKRQYTQVYEKCLGAQKQNEALGRQIATLLTRETDMVEERKQMGTLPLNTSARNR